MNTQTQRLIRQFAIPCEMGLHIRAASLLSKSLSPYRSSVMLQKDDMEVNGRSVLDMLILGANKGDLVVVIVDGDDAHETMTVIVELFDAKFNE